MTGLGPGIELRGAFESLCKEHVRDECWRVGNEGAIGTDPSSAIMGRRSY
jgi:hypothetical protein